MRITFKLYASLSQYLPEGAERNKVILDVAPDASPLEILRQHGVPVAQVHLVLVNGLFIPPSERGNALGEGDELAVWPAVAGG